MTNLTHQQIADEVETSIINNPSAVGLFKKNIAVFNEHWLKYDGAKKNEPQPSAKRTKGYKYDSNCKMWFPKDPPPLPPNPTRWELPADKLLCCYYATLALIYDMLKTRAPVALSDGLENTAYYMLERYLDSANSPFTDSDLKTALKWVKADIEKMEEKDGQSNGGKVDSPNKKSSETWYWKLYEKTIKAVIATILDFLIK